MEQSKKKVFMVGVAAVCIIAAGLVAYMNLPKSSGVDTLSSTTLTWVKCTEKNCGAEYQMNIRDFYKTVEQQEPIIGSTPPIPCKNCGKTTVYRAYKCEKCGLVFFAGINREDFEDKCSGCGYSKTEENKNAKKGR